jgi:hypothetical protein
MLSFSTTRSMTSEILPDPPISLRTSRIGLMYLKCSGKFPFLILLSSNPNQPNRYIKSDGSQRILVDIFWRTGVIVGLGFHESGLTFIRLIVGEPLPPLISSIIRWLCQGNSEHLLKTLDNDPYIPVINHNLPIFHNKNRGRDGTYQKADGKVYPARDW